MSTCEFTSQAHHSDDIVAVFTGRPVPTYLCGFHASEPWRVTALEAIGRERDWLTQSALEHMIGGTTQWVDNKRNALVLRVTKGTGLEEYARRRVMQRRRDWLQWHINQQSVARRKPRTVAAALRFYHATWSTQTEAVQLKNATEYINHREAQVTCK